MRHSNQQGVTLLLAVLIVSSLALVSLAVGTFAIQELRSSRAVLVTEPAAGAAESAVEQGLWAIKRNVALTNCNTGQTTTTLSNGALVNSCETYDNAVFKLKANTPFVFYLYDPSDINGDIDLQGYLTPPCAGPASTNPSGFLYNSLAVTHQSGAFATDITVVRLDNTAVASQSVVPGNTATISLPAPAQCAEGRMKVTLQSIGNATIQVNTNLGLPNYPSISAGGCAARTSLTDCTGSSSEIFNRRIKLTVPQ